MSAGIIKLHECTSRIRGRWSRSHSQTTLSFRPCFHWSSWFSLPIIYCLNFLWQNYNLSNYGFVFCGLKIMKITNVHTILQIVIFHRIKHYKIRWHILSTKISIFFLTIIFESSISIQKSMKELTQKGLEKIIVRQQARTLYSSISMMIFLHLWIMFFIQYTFVLIKTM